MAEDLAAFFSKAIELEALDLRAFHPTTSPAGAWTQKEELGHLIDSATNNHIRFVRGALQQEHRDDGYEQDGWVTAHGYNELSWEFLVGLWESYNQLLVEVVRRIPEEKLTTPCIIKSSLPVTLGFVIEDYVLHMQHHLDHLLWRENVRVYPPPGPPPGPPLEPPIAAAT